MSLPAGVQTCNLTFGGDVDPSGNPIGVGVTATPSTDLIWSATGQRISSTPPITGSASAGSTGSLTAICVDQSGFINDTGQTVLLWWYTIVATYTNGDVVTKKWQPLVGQTTVDFDLIPNVPVSPTVTGPQAVVTSVNGATGAVTVATASPWEFRPEDYGAKGDGKLAHDAATNSTNTFTSATVAASATVGQWVMINGGRGQSDTAAIGTITTISGNNITINTTARSLPINVTATGLDVLWGSDDTAAINSAAAAAKTYAEAHNYTADVVFSDRIYVVSSLTQSNDGNILYNTQIKIPRPTDNNGRKLVIRFRGVERSDHTNYWNSTTTALAGTVIATTYFGPNTQDATFGWQSVFGAGIPVAGGNMIQPLDTGHSNPVFVNHKPVFENIQVLAPVYNNLTAFDWQYSSGVAWDGLSAYAFAQSLYGTGAILLNIWHTSVFASKLGCAMRLPVGGNNADTVGGNVEVNGFTVALSTPSEHTEIGTVKAIYCAVVFDITASGTGHGLFVHRVTAEAYQGGIRNAATSQPGKVPVFIGMWNTELSAQADGGGGYDISDSASTLTGEIHWANTLDTTHQFPVVTGGNNVRVICESVYRGVQTAPTVPATTVALQNPFWRDAVVRVTGGTVTAVVVDGQTVATATNATVTVPTGKTITLTYSSAPTWTWALL